MATVVIDVAAFNKRIGALQKSLATKDSLFNNADSVFVLIGKVDEENPYPKHLKPLESDKVLVWTRSKEAEHNKKLFNDLIEKMASEGSTLGTLPKDKYEGNIVTEWSDIFNASTHKFTEVDVSGGLAELMQIKDSEEQNTIRAAAKASTGVMTEFLSKEIFNIINEERKVTHSKLSQNVEAKLDDNSFFVKNLKLGNNFDPMQLDWCYSPVIESRGDFDLKPSAMSNNDVLYGGTIITFLGLRYKSYCSNIGRTYLIDPTKLQEQNYSFTLALQKKVLESIKDGVEAKSVYQAAVDFIKSKNPSLLNYFLKNVGWGIGIEFRDTSLLLNAKNTNKLKSGMTLCVSIGFHNIPNPDAKEKENKVYSILLTDTVIVTKDAPVLLTDSPINRSSIAFYFEDEEEEKKPIKKEKKPVQSVILKSKLRGEARNTEEDSEQKRKLHQKELHAKLQKLGLEKYADENTDKSTKDVAVFKRFESYKRESQLPINTKDLRIQVDAKNQTIILPINGRPVPFHISTYKNGSKNEEGDYIYLRLNFNSPGQGVNKKEEMPFEDVNAQFVKSITFRSREVERMSEVFKKITDLKKEAQKRDAEKKEMEDVVDQGKLIEIRNRRPLRLDSVFVRPAPEGKRVAGSLEIHQNGLKYQSPIRSDHNVEVLFSNVKHLFFHPCDHELIVLIHCHLKNPIMVGKKKTKDIQFYREATDLAFDETGNRRRRYKYGDEDELEQEQMERQRRAALNKEFKSFAEKISDATNGKLDVDIPFRELGFTGVPFRSDVLCQPTTDCLVQLIDPPFLVVTLQEIEVVHLERVQFGLRQFDMVIIYKDFNKPVTHINSIPTTQLDSVKDWLNEMDLPYFEGPLNLNWPMIMKTVTKDPHDFFFTQGGWSFLDMESDGSGDEESEEESEFKASDEDPSDEESSDYSEAGSDFSEGSEGSGSDEDESGDDWDELDAKAERQDKRVTQSKADETRKRKR
ncbi:hypothetical protein DV454_001076 [Geotrichum candidum]|nr:hypothetical protein DV454_001076 [Geotrichum candidum]